MTRGVLVSLTGGRWQGRAKLESAKHTHTYTPHHEVILAGTRPFLRSMRVCVAVCGIWLFFISPLLH